MHLGVEFLEPGRIDPRVGLGARALDLLWAESWMKLRPCPAPDPKADPARLEDLDAEVDHRSDELRDRLLGLEDEMLRAGERARLTESVVQLHWERALDLLWAESWMKLRPRPGAHHVVLQAEQSPAQRGCMPPVRLAQPVGRFGDLRHDVLVAVGGRRLGPGHGSSRDGTMITSGAAC